LFDTFGSILTNFIIALFIF